MESPVGAAPMESPVGAAPMSDTHRRTCFRLTLPSLLHVHWPLQEHLLQPPAAHLSHLQVQVQQLVQQQLQL